MKVGDLVKYDTRTQKWAVGLGLVGLVVETGVYVGRKDVKILWNGGETSTQKSSRLEVINEGR
jgi:hypothetical protein